MRRDLRASPNMDSTSQDHGVSPLGARPSLLSSASSPASAPGVRLLDAIDPHVADAAKEAPQRAKSRVLWGLTGAVLLGGVTAWLVSSGHPTESSAQSLTRAAPVPRTPASAPDTSDVQTAAADLSAASMPLRPSTPAQIVAMATPPQTTPAPVDDVAPGQATAANALAAESLAERPPAETAAPRSAAHKPAAKKPGSKTSGSKKSAEGGNSTAKARSKASRQHSEPDPDADVVAAIMAGMDKQAAAAAKSGQGASQPATRRP